MFYVKRRTKSTFVEVRMNKATMAVTNREMELARPSDWMSNMFDLEQFKAAARTGAFERIVLNASLAKFMVEGIPRKDAQGTFEKGVRMVLSTSRRKRPRMFRDPATALKLLREIGVNKVEVQLAGWMPERAAEWGRKRPDMSDRLRFAHEYARPGSAE
jgi:hypothetical protein